MRGLTGHPANDQLTALRSLFRALKQERLIFRDPTKGFTLAAIVNLPTPIPTDRLRGLINRASGPLAKLVVALVAIHGLGKREISERLLADLDLARGRLVVRRAAGRHVVHLDALTHQLATAWLHERQHRWPTTPNPHLLVSQQTADMDTYPPVSSPVINAVFRPLGVRPSALRQDRILDEAKHTADPVHLMRVFGISVATAMDYNLRRPPRAPIHPAPIVHAGLRCRFFLDLGKIRLMSGPIRVTGPLLDVAEVLLHAFNDNAELHGWAILKATKRSGPTVYGVLDRLENAGWITGRWEDQDPESNKPRRRFYQLTPTGVVAARTLLAERRPEALNHSPRPAPGLAFIGRLHALLPGGAR